MPAQMISAVDVHAEGEPGRVLLGSALRVRGSTWAERLRWCEAELDGLRRLVLQEPRGYPALCAVLVLPPLDPGADAGLVVLEQGGFRPMSGSNTMCAVTALLETGTLPITGPETTVVLDTAVGLVRATASTSGSKVTSVRVTNVPAFVHALDHPVEVPEYGLVAADIAFGGQYYAQAPAAALGIDLATSPAPVIARAGAALLAAAREQVPVVHPEQPEVDSIGLVMLHGPATDPATSARNCVVLPAGELTTDPATWRATIDRSPCGTGTSARMAVLHARGELALGEPFVHAGVLGTTFRGLLHEETTVGGRPAVVPSIEGRAWIMAHTQLVLDPTDPFATGYTVGDLWSSTSTGAPPTRSTPAPPTPSTPSTTPTPSTHGGHP